MKDFAENVCIFFVVDNVMLHNLVQLSLSDPMKVKIFCHLNYVHAQNSMYLIWL